MRKILLSFAVLPLISPSVFSTESEPKQDTQQSSEPIVKLDSLRENGIAKIMKINGSLTSTKAGFHIAIPLFPIMLNGNELQPEMNIFEFFSNLQNNPKSLFQQDGSAESQWIQTTKVATKSEAIQPIEMFMKQNIKVVVKVLEKMAELRIMPTDVLLNTIVTVGIKLNFDGTFEVVLPKATRSAIGLILSMCNSINKYEDEIKANEGKIWGSFGEISETDKDAVRATIYEYADLQKSKQALEKQITEQKPNEQKLELLQKKQAEIEASKQEQETKKIELLADIAKMEEQIKQIEGVSSEFESASKALPSAVPATTPNFQSATNSFMTIALKLPETMKAPYDELNTNINALQTNNTPATKKLRSELWEKLKSATTATQQEITKTRGELSPKIAQMKETLEKQASVVVLSQEEQDEIENLQTVKESLKKQMDEIQEKISSMKVEYGDKYQDIKIAARVVQKQPEVKSIDTRIQELKVEDELRRIKEGAMADVEEIQKRVYEAQKTVATPKVSEQSAQTKK